MVYKNRALLQEAMSEDALLFHISGKSETREEYITDIVNGTLNYFDYQIVEFDCDTAVIKLLAKVYGGAKSWWTLSMQLKYETKDGKLKIQKCKVNLANF